MFYPLFPIGDMFESLRFLKATETLAITPDHFARCPAGKFRWCITSWNGDTMLERLPQTLRVLALNACGEDDVDLPDAVAEAVQRRILPHLHTLITDATIGDLDVARTTLAEVGVKYMYNPNFRIAFPSV